MTVREAGDREVWISYQNFVVDKPPETERMNIDAKCGESRSTKNSLKMHMCNEELIRNMAQCSG